MKNLIMLLTVVLVSISTLALGDHESPVIKQNNIINLKQYDAQGGMPIDEAIRIVKKLGFSFSSATQLCSRIDRNHDLLISRFEASVGDHNHDMILTIEEIGNHMTKLKIKF